MEVELDFKPTYLKHISNLWILVTGREPFIEIYSANTLRRVKVIAT